MFAAAAVLLACVACNSNKPAGNGGDADSLSFTESAIPQNPKDLLPSKSLVDSISYLLGINVGEMIKQNDLGDLNFSKIKRPVICSEISYLDCKANLPAMKVFIEKFFRDS